MYLLTIVTRNNNHRGNSKHAETVSVDPHALMTHAEEQATKAFGTDIELMWERTDHTGSKTFRWESSPFNHYGTEMYYSVSAIETI